MQSTPKPLLPLLGMIFLMHFSFSGARLAATLQTIELSERSATITALVLSATYFLPMVGSILLGKWVDRQFKHVPLAVGACVVLLSVMGFSFAWSISTMLLSALLLGAGYQLFQMTVQHIIGKLLTDLEKRAEWFSWLSLTISVSFVLSSVTVGYALEWFKIEKTFLLLLLGPALALLLTLRLRPLMRVLREVQPIILETPAGGSPRTYDLLKNQPLLQVIIVATAVSVAWEMHSFLIPLVGDRRGFAESEIGWIIAGFSFGTLIIRLIMPYLVKRFHAWKIVANGLMLAIIIYSVYPMITDLPSSAASTSYEMFYTMVFCSMVLGVGLGSAQPNIMAQLHEHAPYGRSGEASGLRSTFTYCANFFVPLLLGALSTHGSPLLPFFFLVAMIIAVWVWAFGNKR